MNGFGIIVAALIAIAVLMTAIRLGVSISRTRRMSGEGNWSADGAEISGAQARGTDQRHGHHTSGHHGGGHIGGGGHHHMGGHIGGGGHDIGGGGHHG